MLVCWYKDCFLAFCILLAKNLMKTSMSLLIKLNVCVWIVYTLLFEWIRAYTLHSYNKMLSSYKNYYIHLIRIR